MNLTYNDRLTYFAQDWTDKDKRIGLAQPDRRYHFYTLGRSGMGKSTMLFSKIVQDLQAGRGLALIDPHGDLAEAVLPFVPKERAKNLVYLNPTDDYPISLNPLDRVGDLETHLVADNLLAIFHKIWADSWGPRLSYVLQNSLVTLIENRRTLLALPKLLTDEQFRLRLIKNVKDPFTRYFWEVEFARLTDRQRTEVISPIQNKVGAYLANRHLRCLQP